MPPLASLLTVASRGARSSVIREILALTETADVLSLAGGMPGPGSFPVPELVEATSNALATAPERALQYARTEGITELRATLAGASAAATGRPVGEDGVLVTTGSQQALHLIGRALLDPGDLVAIESPGYLGAIQAFASQEPAWLPVPVDADGIDTGALEDALLAGRRPKLVYTATDFQNPTGAVLALERRRHLAELAERWGFVVVEDDPYGSIRFGEPVLPPVAAFTDRCLSMGTTSKVIAPGLRVGWVVGDADVVATLALLKQAVDLNTSALTQWLTLDLLRRPGWLAARATALRRFYRPRADRLAAALRTALPGAGVPAPRGGLFLWLTLPGIDTAELLPRAIHQGVAFVPGAAFRIDDAPSDQLRASFATLDVADLDEAARRLARAVQG